MCKNVSVLSGSIDSKNFMFHILQVEKLRFWGANRLINDLSLVSLECQVVIIQGDETCQVTDSLVQKRGYWEMETMVFFKNFVYFWLPWVFIAARGLSLVAVTGGLLSSCCAQGFHCGGFSCFGTWALGWACSAVVAHRPSCPEACGIFLDQELNLCLLHWQADS